MDWVNTLLFLFPLIFAFIIFPFAIYWVWKHQEPRRTLQPLKGQSLQDSTRACNICGYLHDPSFSDCPNSEREYDLID